MIFSRRRSGRLTGGGRFGPGGNLFTPVNVPGLYRWFRSDLGVTVDGSNKVSSWADQSGQVGGNATQATGTKQPTLVANVIDGLPVVRFSSASATELALDLTGMVGQPYSLFIVSARRTSNAHFPFGAATGGVANASLQCGWDTSTQALWLTNHWSNDLSLNIGAYTAPKFINVGMFLDPAVGRRIEAFDGSISSTSATKTTLGSIPGGGRIGQAIGNYFEGDILEIFLYTAVVIPADITRLYTYVRTRAPSVALS